MSEEAKKNPDVDDKKSKDDKGAKGGVKPKASKIDDRDDRNPFNEDNIQKAPVQKLRLGPSTLVLEKDSETSLDKVDEKAQKYQMYLGGYSKDQLRKHILARRAKEKALKKKVKDEKVKVQKVQKEKVKKTKELIDKVEEEEAVVDPSKRKIRLLHDGTYSNIDADDLVYYHNPRTRVYLIFIFILMEAFGVAFITLLPIYTILESGSIELYIDRGYSRRGKTIHYTLGALWVFIYGNGFILFRITSAYKVNVLKWIHALVYALVIPIPLYCINSYYKVKEENTDVNIQEHYYTLHSFFGFLATYLYIFEICCGMIVYTLFFYKQVHRNIYYQIHTYVALLGFLLAVSTFCLGVEMEENDILLKASAPNDSIKIYLHLSGIFVCIFAVLALYLIINPDFDVERDVQQ